MTASRTRLTRFEPFVLTAIIAISVALSLFWVFRVPLFQEPDEEQHFDYAYSIYAAGHLITVRDGEPRFTSHPLVRAMVRESGFRTMRYNTVGRVPNGYGSSQYFQNLDASVRSQQASHATNEKTVPNLVRSYAYLYYALDAAAIALGSIATRGSPSGEFFFARSFSVVLLSISLLFTYLTLRELPLTPTVRLGIVAAIGWFPLTTWVSAYVQPDNLALTVVSASLFLGYYLRRHLANPWSFAWLGLAIGALWLTKIQYFVAVAPAVATSLALMAARQPRSTAYWAKASLCVVLPLTVAYASNRWVVSGGGAGPEAFVNAFGHELNAAAVGGIAPLTAFVLREISAAYTQTFVWGVGFFTYYGYFGWIPTPIFPGRQVSLLEVVYLPLSVISEAVSIIMIYRMLRTWRGLKVVAKAKGATAGLRLLSSDIVLNSYLTFIVLIIAVWVKTGGTLGQYGRYWLPFELATVLCAVYYAPQVIPRHFGRLLSTGALIGLLIYSTTAAFAEPEAIQARFYLPPPTAMNAENLAFIDRIGGAFVRQHSTRIFDVARRGDALRVGGWAIDSRLGQPARKVELVIDHETPIPAKYGLPNGDRLSEIRNWDDDLLNTSFVADVKLSQLHPGDHILSLLVYEHDRSQPYPSSEEVHIHIDSSPQRSHD